MKHQYFGVSGLFEVEPASTLAWDAVSLGLLGLAAGWRRGNKSADMEVVERHVPEPPQLPVPSLLHMRQVLSSATVRIV